MHCDEVIRELVVPSDDRDSAGLAEHLANCPHCAGWAKRDAQFDRLWNATRPTEPSPHVWDTVWAHIASSLESSTPAKFEAIASPTTALNGSTRRGERPIGFTAVPSRSRPSNWAAIGLIGLAQAAAVLFVVGLTWFSSRHSQDPQMAIAVHTPALSPDSSEVSKQIGLLSGAAVEIEAGRWMVIRMEESAAKVVDLTPEGVSWSVDDLYLAFNAVEAIANPVIVMKE